MVRTGLDRLLQDPAKLDGRRYALLTHAAAVTAEAVPGHLALQAAGLPPELLLAPEHGLYGVEQDMVAAEGGRDPSSGLPVLSLYGDTVETLKPDPAVFDDLDLLVVDLQDVGSRYYTYAASAIWTVEVAAEAGCDVWILDRPNPLGGVIVEGNLPKPGFESFVGAFEIPVRHGLTLGELTLLLVERRGWAARVGIWDLEGWHRGMRWEETGLPWIAPSPNMPTLATARVYPGGCLVEATELSEGRGTTRPFQLVGAPHLDAAALAKSLEAREIPGVAWVPTYFRPQFQKHAGRVCGGVELVVTDPHVFPAYRAGVELLRAVRALDPEGFAWREKPYEFVADRPAIDLLTGSTACREAIENGAGVADWIATWTEDEARFRERRRGCLLYPATPGGSPS